MLLKIAWTVTTLGSVGVADHHYTKLVVTHIVEENSWPLIVLSTWIVDFLEELLRECVLLGDSREGLGEEITGVS
jgi:hypothetical protein